MSDRVFRIFCHNKKRYRKSPPYVCTPLKGLQNECTIYHLSPTHAAGKISWPPRPAKFLYEEKPWISDSSPNPSISCWGIKSEWVGTWEGSIPPLCIYGCWHTHTHIPHTRQGTKWYCFGTFLVLLSSTILYQSEVPLIPSFGTFLSLSHHEWMGIVFFDSRHSKKKIDGYNTRLFPGGPPPQY